MDRFGEAGTFFFSKRPLMSQEQHKGDNHQGKTRKKGRRHFKGGGGNTSGVLGFFFLEPALVFFSCTI